MLPDLLADLLGVQLFGYISFRMAAAGLCAFVFALIGGRYMIPWLRARGVGEDVSKSDSADLAAHAAEMGKAGTPTMGGSFMVGALLLAVLLWARLDNVHVILAIALTAGLAAVGFVDDFRKLTDSASSGLSERGKLIGQSLIILAVLAAFIQYARTTGRADLLSLYPPFFKDHVLELGALGLGGLVLWAAFEWVVIFATSNAANMTDGLDGLAAGCMLISGLALSIFCYVTGRPDWTHYLNLPHVAAASEMAVVGGALTGACMGFLWFNAHPAQVFMGDSGSLPIGGLLAWMAVVSKQELVLPLIAAVFVLDAGSSLAQRLYFKGTGGRRLFTMAPIHHGLEIHGGIFQRGGRPWAESIIVIRCWIVAAICAMASLALMKVR
ncbi:MAG: phospho-N-acetylmuramoyl-pentapeptide-transferase [Planctomycetota bacterium]|nr:phospho-N-acetylmuramoyl-pentapeptide-transferase [Planctomycetota bacterium]MDP6837934.1 phospho-N-acetylmuramoyl-pentapeptide-transferase [Planctomycetota bacterium]